MIKKFEEIESWQMAKQLTNRVYELTQQSEFSTDFGLKDQIRRAAGSVMHNIAEGFDAGGNIEFQRFLRYARRSCTEVQSQLYVAVDQRYITDAQFNETYELARLTRAKIGAFINYSSTYTLKP